MKRRCRKALGIKVASRPRGGVWIETGPRHVVKHAGRVTPPRGRVD